VSDDLLRKYGLSKTDLDINPTLKLCVELRDEDCIKRELENMRKSKIQQIRPSFRQITIPKIQLPSLPRKLPTEEDRVAEEKEWSRRIEAPFAAKTWSLPWQAISLMVILTVFLISVPFPIVGLFLSPIVVFLVKKALPHRLPIERRGNILVYKDVKLSALKVKYVHSSVDSLEPTTALMQVVGLANAVRGYYYDGENYYLFIDGDPKRAAEALMESFGVVAEPSELPQLPLAWGRSKAEWAFAIAHLGAGIAVFPLLPLVGIGAIIASVLAVLYTYSDEKYAIPLITPINDNLNAYGNKTIESWYAEVRYAPLPRQMMVIWRPYPQFEAAIKKQVSWLEYLADILGARSYRLFKAELVARALQRFVGVVQEAKFAAVGVADFGDGARDVAGFRLGRPSEWPFLSADFIYSPQKLALVAGEKGIPVGIVKTGTGWRVHCIDVSTEKNPHVLIVGTTAAGKTFLAMAVVNAIRKRYGARVVAVDPHGQWAKILKAYNIAEQMPPMKLEGENIKWVAEAAAGAGYASSEFGYNSLLQALHEIARSYPGVYVAKAVEAADPIRHGLWTGFLADLASDKIVDFDADVALVGPGTLIERREIARALIAIFYFLSRAMEEAKPWVSRGETAPVRYVLVIDEAHVFLRSQLLSSLLAQLRKFGIVVVAITQNVTDIPPDAITNIAYIMVLHPGRAPQQLYSIATIIGITPQQLMQMTSAVMDPGYFRPGSYRCFLLVLPVGQKTHVVCMPRALGEMMHRGDIPQCGIPVRFE